MSTGLHPGTYLEHSCGSSYNERSSLVKMLVSIVGCYPGGLSGDVTLMGEEGM
jgi:hypothetical protein